MSTEEDKVKHSRRLLQKESHIKRQVKIAKAHNIPVDEPHTLAKHSALTCGDSNCVMCGNPRKFFKEPTIQEKRFDQKQLRD
jgi:hypothetical protein